MITKTPDLFWKQNHVTSQQPRGLCWEPQLIFSSHKRNSPTAASLQTSCRDRTLQSLRTLTQFCGFNSQTLYIRRRALKRTKKREEETHLTFKWRQLAPLHRHGATRPLRTARSGARLPATVFTMSAEGSYVVTEPRYKTTAAKNIRNETFFDSHKLPNISRGHFFPSSSAAPGKAAHRFAAVVPQTAGLRIAAQPQSQTRQPHTFYVF